MKLNKPLKGVKIIDLSSYLAGPFCTMLLADLGADVIKVEQPKVGDGSRQWGPPFIDGESAYFLSINRSKKSLTLNLKSEKGRKVMYKLVQRCDVFIENFKPGITQKLGVDYLTLSKINPKLIYCSISGFGQDGPYRDRPAFDMVIQAMSGLMSITGERLGPPVKVGVAITDILAGIFAATVILSALIVRDRSDIGQMIDISMLDCAIYALSHQVGYYFATGKNPERLGTAHPTIAPYQAFKAADSYFVVGIGNDELWRSFCKAIGLDELVSDPRFIRNPDRVKNRNELEGILSKIFASRPASEWLKLLEKAGVPCGPVYSLNEVFKDPQVIHRGMVKEIQHPKVGKIKVLGIPIKMFSMKASIDPPPLLGEHTEEILRGLGYQDEEIENLRKEGVI